MKKIYLFVLFFVFSAFNAQIVNIPDANFKAKLVNANTSNNFIAKNLQGVNVAIDTNNDGEIQLSEAQNIGELTFAGSLTYNMSSITSLVGIKSFSNLKKITASNFALLQSMDFSDLLFLQNITIESNPNLTNVDIHGTGAIIVKVNNNTNLTNLNAQNCLSMGNLNCSTNKLQSLNVSGLTSMYSLTANNNQLTSINLAGLTSLYDAQFLFNNLSNVVLQNNIALQILNLNGNNLSSIPLNETPNMRHLGIAVNNFTSLDLSHFPQLQSIVAHTNNFSVIDIRQNPNLLSLGCNFNPNLHTLYLKNGMDNQVPLSTYFYSCPNISYICADNVEIGALTSYVASQGYSCIVDSNCSAIPLHTKDISEVKKQSLVYPNPVGDILNIKSKNQTTKVEIYDLTGKIILSSKVKENKVDVSNVTKGNYILKIFTKDNFETEKLIKN